MAIRVPAWKQLIVVALLLAVAGVAWTQRTALRSVIGLSREQAVGQQIKRDRRAPVIVTRAVTAEDLVVVEMLGTGRAGRSIELRAEAEGKVVKMPLEAGKRFSAGDVLVQLASREAQLAVNLAKARLAEADRIRKRFARLKRGGNATVARMDEARTAAQVTRIELAQARQTLAKRVIRAPFDGIGGLTEIEVGAWIDSDVVIARFDDRSAIAVAFDLPETLLTRVKLGMAVRVTTPSAPGQTFSGVVAAVDNRLDAASRSIRIRVSVPNPDDVLRPGASFEVRMDLPGGRYVQVPDLAVQYSRNTLHVWRIVDNKVERVPVRLVRRLEGAVLLEGDLAEGDRIVIEGAQRLRDGKAVRVLEGRG
ncbi:MAG: efflux RND transporter periplasmic adaptor subunit [Alphaproteobacteria bacterium]